MGIKMSTKVEKAKSVYTRPRHAASMDSNLKNLPNFYGAQVPQYSHFFKMGEGEKSRFAP